SGFSVIRANAASTSTTNSLPSPSRCRSYHFAARRTSLFARPLIRSSYFTIHGECRLSPSPKAQHRRDYAPRPPVAHPTTAAENPSEANGAHLQRSRSRTLVPAVSSRRVTTHEIPIRYSRCSCASFIRTQAYPSLNDFQKLSDYLHDHERPRVPSNQ